MNWLMWRQYRKQLLLFVGVFVVFAAIAVPGSLHFWHHYQHILSTCEQTDSCGQIRNMVFHTQTDGLVANFVKLTLLGLPILLGLFWGVPLVAKEYAENTNKLAWTQGVSRGRWLTSKIAWVLLATVVYAGGFAALATWFSRTSNAINHDKFAALAFSSQGVVPVAATVFAVALGILFGAWFKKLLPAFGATLGLLMVVQIAVPLVVRPHYQPLLTSTQDLNLPDMSQSHPRGPSAQDWVISSRQATDGGQVLDTNNPPEQCVIKQDGTKAQGGAFASGGGPIIGIECLKSLGYHWQVRYQPEYRYWDFQRIEAAIFLTLTGLAVSATYTLVLKRDA